MSKTSVKKSRRQSALGPGYTSIKADAEIHGWFSPTTTVTAEGDILSYEERAPIDGMRQSFYVMKLITPVEAVLKEGEIVLLSAGDNLGVRESTALEVLRECIGQTVMIVAIEKIQSKTKKGQTFWRYEVGVKNA